MEIQTREMKAGAKSSFSDLAELNRLPYSGLWFFDGRFHNLGAGFVVTRLSVAGSAQTSQMTTQNVSEKLDYYGFFGDYYVPLLGYSPELSVGLLPVLKLEAGGFFDTTNNALSDRTEAELGILVELPVFAMARIGRRASRVGAWDLSVGAGVGLSLIHFSAGGPIVSSPSYLAPALRLEVAYKVFQLAYESALSSHDESFGGADHLRYQSHSIMIGAFFQPEVDD